MKLQLHQKSYKSQPDTAEVLLAARIPLGQLETNTAYAIKLRGFSVAHREDLKVHVFSETTAGGSVDLEEGHLVSLPIHLSYCLTDIC